MRLKLAPMGLDPRVYQKISFRWIAGSSQVKPGNDGIEFISLLSALSRVALRK
jgi:hypothetical protein